MISVTKLLVIFGARTRQIFPARCITCRAPHLQIINNMNKKIAEIDFLKKSLFRNLNIKKQTGTSKTASKKSLVIMKILRKIWFRSCDLAATIMHNQRRDPSRNIRKNLLLCDILIKLYLN